MAIFNIKKAVAGYIKPELEARRNPVTMSSMKPWIRATSNLGGGKALFPTKYKTILGGATAMYNVGDQNRPNPIITGWSVDFSSRGTLRKGTLTIQCFSATQLTEIQRYFMTPALSVIVEWGWNKSATGGSVKEIKLDPVVVASYYNDDDKLQSKRASENGCYDNMLGIITKASSDVSGTDFTVTCTIASIGELLMGMSRRGQEVPKETTEEDSDKYDLGEFVNDTNDEIRPWAYFFNSLKPQFQTSQLKEWGESGGEGKINPLHDFINYDDLWVQDVKDETTKTSAISTFFGFKNAFKFLEKEWTPYSEQTPILDKKYVKFSALIAIFNKISKIKGTQEGSVISPFIDIGTKDNGVMISAFKEIFSPDTRMFIPNKQSYNFYNKNPFYVASPGSSPGNTIDNSLGGYSFPSDAGSIKCLDGSTAGVDSQCSGWLGDVYVSSDLADQLLTDSEGDLKDILDQMLSQLSEASQGLWHFQVVPETKKGGALVLQIVDARLNDTKEIAPLQLYFSGPNSVFLEASYNLDLPKAMANKLAMSRVNKTLVDVDGISKLSIEETDTVMQNVLLLKRLRDAGGNKPAPENPGDEEHQKQLWEAFCRNAGILIKPEISSDLGGTWLATVGKDISEYLLPGVSTDVDTFNELRINNMSKGKPPGITSLPFKINFTVTGISGFRFGDVLSIIGLPPPYDGASGKGLFLVVEVKHKVDDKLWTTEVEAQFRPNGR